jgi:hypothetical protein
VEEQEAAAEEVSRALVVVVEVESRRVGVGKGPGEAAAFVETPELGSTRSQGV